MFFSCFLFVLVIDQVRPGQAQHVAVMVQLVLLATDTTQTASLL
jgi:hypothetical protein